MKPRFAALLTALASALGPWTAWGAPANPLAITNVTVIDATGAPPRPGQTVLIRDRRIAVVGSASSVAVPRGATRVDGRGRYLIPALWDMHVHLANRPPGEPPSESLLPLLLAHGVVGVRDMGGDFDRIRSLRDAVASNSLRGPRIVAPGPFLDGPQEPSPMVVPAGNAEQARQAVRDLKARGVDFIKLQAALSAEAWRAGVQESVALGIPVAGHVPEAVSAWDVVGSGQRSIEHVSPALPGDASILLACSSREAELRAELHALGEAARVETAKPEDLRARQRALQEALLSSYDATRAAGLFARMAAAGVTSVPTLIWSQTVLPRSKDDLAAEVPLRYVPKAMAARWRARRAEYLERAIPETLALHRRLAERSLALVGELHRAGVAILAGTDSFDGFVLPGFALHQELELLVAAGLTPLEALQAATREPARFLGEKDRGTIEAGKLADLVLLEADPLADIRHTRKIAAVVQGGDLLDRAALDRLLADLETRADR